MPARRVRPKLASWLNSHGVKRGKGGHLDAAPCGADEAFRQARAIPHSGITPTVHLG